jgi:hypothetical protein
VPADGKIAQPQGRRRLGGAEEGRHEQYLHKRLGGAPGNGDRLPEIQASGDETRGAREYGPCDVFATG